jgi:ABC-2 type transport system ATP-binding protein
MAKKLLEVRGLSRSFGEVQAVAGLNLQVRGGEIFGLMGPDGAGKTTLIRMICGAILSDDGEVLINGISMRQSPDAAREQLGYLSQRFSLYEDLTVIENLRFFAEMRGMLPREWQLRTMEILEFVGLSEFVDRRTGKLSGGMKQKLGLAIALVNRPRLLLLDEPTGGVDPVTRQDFWQLLIRLVAEEGVGVLVSTPYLDEAIRCTYVGMMVGGGLVLEGPPEDLLGNLEGQVLELRGKPLLRWRRLAVEMPGVVDTQVFGDRLHLRLLPNTARQVTRALRQASKQHDFTLEEIVQADPLLDDVFIAILSEYAGGEGLYGNNHGSKGGWDV